MTLVRRRVQACEHTGSVDLRHFDGGVDAWPDVGSKRGEELSER